MSLLMAPGLARPHERCPIRKSSYNFETHTAGLYVGDFMVALVNEFNPRTCQLTLADMLQALTEYSCLQGIYIVNNDTLVGVGDGYFQAITHKNLYRENFDWQYLDRPKAGCLWKPRIQVGWVLTKPMRADLPIPPYALMVDVDNRTSWDYTRMIDLPNAIPCKDFNLYRELLTKPDCDVVYMTPTGPVFTKGEYL